MQQHLCVVPDFAIKNDPQCCFPLTFPLNTVCFVLFRAVGGTNVSDTKLFLKLLLKDLAFIAAILQPSAEAWTFILCIWMDNVEYATLIAGYVRIVYFASEKHHPTMVQNKNAC